MANISVYHSVPHDNLFALLCLPPMKNREFAQPLQVQKNISFPYPFNFTLPGWQLTSFLPFKECKKTSASCSPLYFKQRNAEKQTKYQKAPILVRKQAPSSLQLPSHRVQDRACPSLDALPYLTTGSQVITTVQNRTRINQRAIESRLQCLSETSLCASDPSPIQVQSRLFILGEIVSCASYNFKTHFYYWSHDNLHVKCTYLKIPFFGQKRSFKRPSDPLGGILKGFSTHRYPAEDFFPASRTRFSCFCGKLGSLII